MASWHEGGKTRNVHIGMKAEALGNAGAIIEDLAHRASAAYSSNV